MTKEERREFLDDLKKEVGELVQEIVGNQIPPIAVSPYVNLNDEEEELTGLIVDPVDDEEMTYARIIVWQDFADNVLRNDPDLIKRYYPLFRDLTGKMAKAIDA